jgi:hypothetical protein
MPGCRRCRYCRPHLAGSRAKAESGSLSWLANSPQSFCHSASGDLTCIEGGEPLDHFEVNHPLLPGCFISHCSGARDERVAPMLRHAYTDTTAAHKALIAAQFATALQLVWRAIWQFLDTILLAVSWRGIGWLLQDHLHVSRLQLVMAAPAAESLPVDAEDHKRIGPRWLRLRG